MRAVSIGFSEPAILDADLASFEAIIPPRGQWSLCQQVSCCIDDDEIEPRWPCGHPVERSMPAERMAKWRRSVPIVGHRS